MNTFRTVKTIVRFWLPPLLWMAVIFVFSTRQRLTVSSTYVINFLFFKILHVFEYALLFIFYWRALKNTLKHISHRNGLFLALFLTICYAFSDELHQSFVPTRESRLRDVIIDTIGGVIAWYLTDRILPQVPKKLKELVKHWQII